MRSLQLISIFSILLLAAACATTQPEPPAEVNPPYEPEPVIVQPEPEVSEPEEEISVDIPDEILEDGFIDEPEVLIVEEDIEDQDEYARSLGDLDTSEISEDTFSEDKEQILAIIEKLNRIMRNKDFTAWVTYVSDDSREYWSDAKNLSELSAKLPGNGMVKLKNLKDYFEKFFIPSRKGRVIDEIRYVTTDLVKAVQYKNNEDITTYLFIRNGDSWLIVLDTGTEE